MLRRLLLAASLSLATLAVPAFAGEAAADAPAKAGPGTAAVKRANETITKLLKDKAAPAKVTAGVRDFLDIDELGKAALADHWGGLKKAEQDEFLKVLRELIEANYTKGMNANLAYTVDYLGEKPAANGDLVVQTKINATRKGRPLTISVDYVLRKSGTNLKAYDVITDGAGLVENYRAQFNKLIKDKGFAAVIDTMKKKAAQISQSAATPTKS